MKTPKISPLKFEKKIEVPLRQAYFLTHKNYASIP